MSKRTLVIGDIHGGLLALKQVLDRCEYDPTRDNLIFLGDYVDGWGESAEVIDFLIELKDFMKESKRHPDSLVFLEGNHDQWLKEFLDYGNVPQGWLENGGKTTLKSYLSFWKLSTSPETLEAHREFFRALKPYYIDNKDRAYVHAGCDLKKGPAGTLPYLRVWDRRMWNKVLTGAKFKAHSELFIGHTSTCSLDLKSHYPEAKIQRDGKNFITVPINRQNVWNIDTGAGWFGKLTVIDADTKEFWQSDFVNELYPDERGRM